MSDETSVVRTIGRYHALDEVGRGAMGVVYRAFDPVIGRTVALKTIGLAPGDSDAKTLRERLYREASAAGTLTHPNIVTVYDVIEDGATAAVAMEFVEGQTLATLIAQRGALPMDRALELFEQICSALDYAGTQGIVHRDIKPANILLTPDGRVKVTDFGIARLAASGLTQTSTIMGSPSYMSPEQVRGLPLDRRSDLFSATVILYEMLTGERPFTGDDVATTMYRIVNESPRAIEEFNPTIGQGISAVLHRALAKAPGDRYQTGAELVAELRRAHGTGSQPIGAIPLVMPAPSKRKLSPLVVIGIPGAAIVVLLVALVLIGGSPDSTKSPSQSEHTTAAPALVTDPVEPAAPPVTIPEPATATPPAPTGPLSTVPPARPIEPAAAASQPSRSSRESVLPSPSGDRSPSARRAPHDADPPLGDRPALPPSSPRTSEAPAARSPLPAATPASSEPASAAAPAPPAATGHALVVAGFDGPAYPVTLFAGDARIGRLEAPTDSVSVEPGSIRLRATNESIFLNADLGTLTLRPGERRILALPGIASAVLSVKGEDYAGVRITIDGRPVPGPYPAQIGRIAAGTHQIVYRWISGASAGREITGSATMTAAGHFLVRAGLDNDQIVVQQLR